MYTTKQNGKIKIAKIYKFNFEQRLVKEQFPHSKVLQNPQSEAFIDILYKYSFKVQIMPFTVPNSHIQHATYANGKWTRYLKGFCKVNSLV